MLFDKSLFQQVLTAYKAVFVSKQWPEEKYKWVAVKHFQDNWDIDAPDFAAMLKNALSFFCLFSEGKKITKTEGFTSLREAQLHSKGAAFSSHLH